MPIAQLLPVTRVSVRPPQRVEATQHDHASAFGHSRRSGRAAMIPDLPSTTDFGWMRDRPSQASLRSTLQFSAETLILHAAKALRILRREVV